MNSGDFSAAGILAEAFGSELAIELPKDEHLQQMADLASELNLDTNSAAFLQKLQISLLMRIADISDRKCAAELATAELKVLDSCTRKAKQCKIALDSGSATNFSTSETSFREFSTSEESLFLKAKIDSYNERIEDAMKLLEAIGICEEQELPHVQVEKNAEKMESLEKEVHDLESKISTFLGLPPNLEEARKQVVQAKLDLKSLDGEITKRIKS